MTDSGTDILERLQGHRALQGVPADELAWLAARGSYRRFDPGDVILPEGADLRSGVIGLEIVLTGRFGVHRDGPGGRVRVMEWSEGDISGALPFSRMKISQSEIIADTLVENFSLDPSHFPDLVRECPTVTTLCVHTMLDRARVFRTSDLQGEKMASLGKLSAGLAHELNNPASAIARSAQKLGESMAEADRAARALARVGLTAAQLEALDRLRETCLRTPPTVSMSPLERADREDLITEWLEAHGADDSAAEALTETVVTLEALDELAGHLEGEVLDAALDWVAAGWVVRTLAQENESAGARISQLVGAMKRLTHMDRAPVAEPIDLEQGLRDTLVVLGHKAREKSLSLKVEVAPDLPRVVAVGGELQQVWMNLLDNAFDAVDVGGQVSVTVQPEGNGVLVCVLDDGHGIPKEHQRRIFDPFFTTKAPGEGTGLGLDIARAHLQRHGGNIDFSSRPGRTEFRVRLSSAPDSRGETGS
jgi:signal transduction histidine kinase